MVGGVFSNVADSYDVMNDAMSLGVHRVWKNYFVDQIGPIRARRSLAEDGSFKFDPMAVLDVAGGTGDISFKILEKSRRDNPHKDL
jgi:2-methoxy-6-polyprenyl-1,4-benzoquinol methylase